MKGANEATHTTDPPSSRLLDHQEWLVNGDHWSSWWPSKHYRLVSMIAMMRIAFIHLYIVFPLDWSCYTSSLLMDLFDQSKLESIDKSIKKKEKLGMINRIGSFRIYVWIASNQYIIKIIQWKLEREREREWKTEKSFNK